MLRWPAGVCLLVFGTCWIFSQTAPPLAFEAASIKPNVSGSGNGGWKESTGQIVFTNVQLRELIMEAYGILEHQLVSPEWTANVRFDIAAKYPPGEPTRERRREMLRTLLAERFHLTIHREKREMPAYALGAAKNGPKLEKGQPGGPSTSINSDQNIVRIDDKGVTMEEFANQLSSELERPVVDKTGLPGVYNLKLRWTPLDQLGATPGVESTPSIFTALQEQIGLKLQTQKLPVEIVVVDRVDRTPVEN